MDIFKFYRQSLEQQLELVTAKGKHIAERTDAGHRIGLYYLDGLFAELFYNHQTNNIEKVVLFRNVDFLDPYLDRIEIRGKEVH